MGISAHWVFSLCVETTLRGEAEAKLNQKKTGYKPLAEPVYYAWQCDIFIANNSGYPHHTKIHPLVALQSIQLGGSTIEVLHACHPFSARKLLLPIACIMLSGCTVGEDYVEPELDLDDAYRLPLKVNNLSRKMPYQPSGGACLTTRRSTSWSLLP